MSSTGTASSSQGLSQNPPANTATVATTRAVAMSCPRRCSVWQRSQNGHRGEGTLNREKSGASTSSSRPKATNDAPDDGLNHATTSAATTPSSPTTANAYDQAAGRDTIVT